MLPTLPTIAAILALATIPNLLCHAARDAEPPLRLVLEIDGTAHELTDGQEIEVAVGELRVRAKASVQATRRFEAAGITFDFPRDMTFDSDTSPAVDQWTLDGGDCVLIVSSFPVGEPDAMLAQVLGGVVRRFDRRAKAPEAVRIELGDRVLDGLRARAEVRAADTTIEWHGFALSAQGRSVVVLLQDSLDDDGQPSAESRRILELLGRSFRRAK